MKSKTYSKERGVFYLTPTAYTHSQELLHIRGKLCPYREVKSRRRKTVSLLHVDLYRLLGDYKGYKHMLYMKPFFSS